jgi:hypothetical protein
MNGQRGNLPGQVAAELGEERLTLGGVETADSFRDQIGIFDVVKRAKLLHKVLFAAGAGDGDAGEMLDGGLAGVSGFRSANPKR